MSYRVRRAGRGDLPRILALMSELRPDADPCARHEWLYRRNPAGEGITFLAVTGEGDEPAGMVSIFPWRLLAAGRPALAALGGDDYVRPAHRRRGLASTMHTACRMALEGLGIQLVFGTPTGANASPLAAAGTHDVTRVARYVVPRTWLRILRPTWALGSFGTLSAAESPDPRIDAVWERIQHAPERIGAVRDSRFYDWRFREAPSRAMHPVVLLDGGVPFAACALERRGQRTRILDLVVADEDFGRALRVLSTRVSCDALELRATDERAADLHLRGYGFLPRDTSPLNVMLPHGISPADAALYRSGARWSATWADTDVESTWRSDGKPPVPRAIPQAVEESQSGAV